MLRVSGRIDADRLCDEALPTASAAASAAACAAAAAATAASATAAATSTTYLPTARSHQVVKFTIPSHATH
eukprot:scaffold17353_cov30-Phaeocystis_antarctica.AAC.1